MGREEQIAFHCCENCGEYYGYCECEAAWRREQEWYEYENAAKEAEPIPQPVFEGEFEPPF